jgi:WD40 repeat protein
LFEGTLRINRDPQTVDWPNNEVLDVEAIVIDLPADQAECVRFSPDGRYLAAGGGDGKVLIYDMSERRLHCTLSGGDEVVRTVIFSDDSKLLFS